jgi:hypothetical protein
MEWMEGGWKRERKEAFARGRAALGEVELSRGGELDQSERANRRMLGRLDGFVFGQGVVVSERCGRLRFASWPGPHGMGCVHQERERVWSSEERMGGD